MKSKTYYWLLTFLSDGSDAYLCGIINYKDMTQQYICFTLFVLSR